MPVSGSVLLLYAGAHKISLKYLFQEKCSSKYAVKNARYVTQFVRQPFSIEFQGFVQKNLNIYTRILDNMRQVQPETLPKK